MRITALQPQTTNPDRTNVFVDDKFLLGVHTLIVLQMGLQVEQELSNAQLEQLRREELLQQGIDRAMYFLSLRPRSRQEVRRYLRRHDIPLDLIEIALNRLEEVHLIDDQAFASFWIESRERFRPKGAHALKTELRLKGVQQELVEEMVSDEQDEDRALRAGRKKAMSLTRLGSIDFVSFRSRLGSFLLRRGFSYEIANRVVRTLWQEVGGDDPGDAAEE